MRIFNSNMSTSLSSSLILLTVFASGCSSDDSSDSNTKLTATSTSSNNKVLVTFNEAMDLNTFHRNSFTVKRVNEMALSGDITFDPEGKTAIFIPSSDFTVGQEYTATITTAAKSATGKSLDANYVWTFTSGTTP